MMLWRRIQRNCFSWR